MNTKLIYFIIILFLTSCFNQKSELKTNLKHQVLTELFLIKAEDLDAGKLEVNNDVIKNVDTLIQIIKTVDNIDTEELTNYNAKLKMLIQSANIGDSLKNNILLNFQGIDEKITANDILINTQTVAFFLRKKYYDNLINFDLVKPIFKEIETDSGRYLEVQLVAASSGYRPNIYIGNMDSVKIDSWYRYKMNNYSGDHFKEMIFLGKEKFAQGIYQIHTNKGNMLIRFSNQK